jgi:Arc/MetJ family transcription regulator
MFVEGFERVVVTAADADGRGDRYRFGFGKGADALLEIRGRHGVVCAHESVPLFWVALRGAQLARLRRFCGATWTVVYSRCMSRTNIDIDDDLCQRVMDRYHLTTKRDAVNLALSRLAGEPLGLDEARSLRGSGWDGDLDELRASRA